MSKTITIIIGDDKTLLVSVTRKDLVTKVSAPQDLAGAFVYFRGFTEDGATELVLKDNDPAGADVGITILDQIDIATRGKFEVDIDHDDFAAQAALAGKYSVKIRLDPTGEDERFTVARNGLVLLDEEIAVP